MGTAETATLGESRRGRNGHRKYPRNQDCLCKAAHR
jgi:hypothetical protein